ncbi:MAG: hypothetical protein COC06_10630 [Bacteroidales bacterium]|nr:MAG: hypothetical protein COC06_10630 [Bacteroidales bacterium]
MNLRRIYYFTAKCLTLDNCPEYRKNIVLNFTSGEVTPLDFITFCDHQLVLPTLYSKFKKHDLLYLFPEDLVLQWETIYLLNKKRNEGIIQQIDDMNSALLKEGITPVYMKGSAHLLDGVYPDIGERMMSDIDFLVCEKDFQKTVDLFLDLGYSNPNQFYCQVNKLKHYPTLYKKDVTASIEIHRIPVDFEYSKQYSAKMVLDRKKTITGKTNCFVSSDNHKLTHNFIHSQLGNKGYLFKKTPLRDLYDLYLLSQRVKPEAIISRLEEKLKAKAYFSFADKLLNLNGKLYSSNSKRVKLHCFVCDNMLIYRKTRDLYTLCVKLVQLFFVRYLGLLLHAVCEKQSREFIWKRLQDRHWYKRHLHGLKTYFRSN